MSGGVYHALEYVKPEELAAAVDGVEFFGLLDVAAFLQAVTDGRELSSWTGETELIVDLRYGGMIPRDSYLMDRFEGILGQRPADFAPLVP